MVEYLHIPCPSCRQVLRVRKQYVGIEVTCTRCGQSFLVEAPQDQPAEGATRTTSELSHEACERQIAELKAEIGRVSERFAKVVEENSRAAEQLHRLNEQYSKSESRVLDLERSLAESQEVIRTSESLIKLDSLDALLTENRQESTDPETGLSLLPQDIRKLRADRERLATAEQSHTQLLEQVRAELEDAKRSLSDVTAAHQASLEKLQHELDSSRQSWITERQELERQIADERSQRVSLEEQLNALKPSTMDNGNLRDECDRLARNLEQERQRSRELQEELLSVEAAAAASASHEQPAAPQPEESSERLQQALAENDRLRSVIRGLGISV
jgi:chromosome segregation ATPase